MAREDGQATVELLGVVPALLALGLVVWQLTLVGHAAWMAAHAARAAARADLVGEDARAAARSALPQALEPGLRVHAEDGATRVEVPVPIMRPEWGGPVRIAARAALEPVP
jgi:TadE-like protein